MNTAIKERVIELAREGVSYYEIERTLGVQHATASKWARAAGIKRGRGGGCVANRASQMTEEKLCRLRDMYDGRYEFLELRPGGHAHVRCLSCGCEFDRTIDLRYSITCPECERRRAENHAEELKQIADAAKKKSLMQALVNCLAYTHVCQECGREFRSRNPQKVYCSHSCALKRKGDGDSVKRAKRYGVEYDRSISLDKLIDRDGPTCYICGKTCTKDDKRWGSFGPDYPTIDHIVPLSKGGTHTWDNVAVACGECNCAIKGDKMPDEKYPGGLTLVNNLTAPPAA